MADMTDPYNTTVVRKTHPLTIVLAALAAGLFVVSLAVFAASGTPAAEPSPSPVVVYSFLPSPRQPDPILTTSAKPSTAVSTVITEGTWVVGLDFPAGRYRTLETVDSDCYWAIYKSGTNGDDIIANDIPGGGRPTVTLKKGQDFATRRCGTWTKIG